MQKCITWLSNPSFEISECIQCHLRGHTETYGFESKSDTLCVSLKYTERSKERTGALVFHLSRTPAESLRDYEAEVNSAGFFLTPHSHLASFLYNPLSPIAILFDLKWICKNVICETPRTVKQAGRNHHNEKVMCILKELFFSVLPGN